MKVGVVTIHHMANYGAMLQSYALSAHLRKSGFDTEVVDYRPRTAVEYFRVKAKFPPAMKAWIRSRRCAAFLARELPLSPKRYETVEQFIPDAAGYDALVAGSDQIWFTGSFQQFDRMYFLDFPARGVRKISYAPSVGGIESFGPYESEVSRALQGFDRVSARDDHTSDMVLPLLGRRPTEVLDPVFLDDFDRFDSELSARPQDGPYLLVFGNFAGKSLEMIRDAARVRGLSVVTLQYPCAVADRRVASPGPVTWMRYFRHASFIVTSYFHGTAFAVKFRREFVSVPTPGRRKKVLGLLMGFGLADRYLETVEGAEDWRTPRDADWRAVDQALGARIASSKAFLLDALVPTAATAHSREVLTGC